MSIDLSQFHQVFFEESFEGLDIMESGLLELSPDAVNSDDINTIFRAAHSIKGGAGTFGFQLVSDFTHVVETLLDQYRSGSRPVTQSGVDLILESVDVLRALLQDLQAGSSPDTTASDALKKQFEVFLAAESVDEPAANTEVQTASLEESTAEIESMPQNTSNDSGHWAIVFTPSADIVQTGNEPFRIIRELSELGTVTVQVQTDRLPEFSALDPEQIFLYWHIQLYAACTKEVVMEVFEWVIDDSKVEIEWVTDNDVVSVANVSKPDFVPDNVKPVHEPNPIKSTAAETTENQADESPKNQDSKPVRAAAVETQSIRVSIDKIDSLINMVGELVITQSMLGQIGHDFSVDKLQRLQEGLMQLEQNTREMQESVMRIRMVPISFTFSRFPRLVRDIAKKLGKKINLQLLGENTELDKTVMEKIGDPLVHMVRNSMDHGIESPEQRLAHGKPAEGQLTLNAYHQGGYIVIEISDDGKGIDPQIIRKKAIQNGLITEDEQLSDQQLQELIFHPGLSTAEAVSDLSGRGVGMDVVKRNIQELKGTVELVSKVGEGSLFRIKLPLTLSILDGQLLRLGDETFVLPLTSIIESIEVRREQVSTVAGETDVIVLRDEYVPVVRLYEVFNIEPVNKSIFDGIVVVVESANQKIGLHVDDLLAQQQVVIKSLDTNYKRIEGLSGATILGDGTVALIVDIAGLLNIVGDKIDQTSVAMKTAS
ncbi:MAG: chemotaxis protein CheA [Reinekea sp.]|nr:chemotaxis protein CheA [Reinekea sp.]